MESTYHGVYVVRDDGSTFGPYADHETAMMQTLQEVAGDLQDLKENGEEPLGLFNRANDLLRWHKAIENSPEYAGDVIKEALMEKVAQFLFDLDYVVCGFSTFVGTPKMFFGNDLHEPNDTRILAIDI